MGMLEVCEGADNTPIAATPIIGDESRPCPVVEENQIAVRMESSFVVGWSQLLELISNGQIQRSGQSLDLRPDRGVQPNMAGGPPSPAL